MSGSRLVGSIVFFVALHLACVSGHSQNPAAITKEQEQIAERLLSQLTLEEKVSLLGGTGFETKPIPRLGIPALNMTDGPLGVRWDKSSAFPASVMMAAAWNPALIERLGAALGREAKAKGRRMLLGPCVNIHRTPFGGRNFESFGEDPFLAARTTVGYVRGVQSENVVATTKHYACNNQEHERDFTNVRISERALREIYLPAFEAAVKEGGTMSVMSAYNKVNGLWCSENPHLLTTILKHEWGFPGFVVSDWGAVHSTIPTANAGLDVEMPTGQYLNADSLLPAITAGRVSVATIDDKIRRLLRTMAWAGLFDNMPATGALNTAEHRQLAYEVASEGIVLLKNEGNLLPFDRATLKSLAVLGPNAAKARTGGGGSSRVEPLYAVSILDAVTAKFGKDLAISYAPGGNSSDEVDPIKPALLRPAGGAPGVNGLKAEYFANPNLEGTPALTRVDASIDFAWGGEAPAPGLPLDNFSARWTGTLTGPVTGRCVLRSLSDDGVRVYLDDKLLIDDWTDHGPSPRDCSVTLEAGKQYGIRVEYYERGGGALMRLGLESTSDKLLAEAVAVAARADAVILCLGSNEFIESEGYDRKDLNLPDDQLNLLQAVAAVNKRTVVVLNTGAPVLCEGWGASVPALLETWFPGEEGGNAIVDALFGAVNPSGKLPMTFPKRWEDSPAFGNFPGSSAVDYAEGVYVGYRHFDTRGLDVSFPFGFGLSYTTFAMANISVVPVDYPGRRRMLVSCDVRNTGTRAGAEVVQVYVHPVAPPIDRPAKELKGFKKVFLLPGESKRVEMLLDDRSLAYYDATRKDWVVAAGEYEILIGNSSRDTQLRASVSVRTQ